MPPTPMIVKPGDPASALETITPSNTIDLGHVTRYLYVGVAGNVQVTMQNGTIGNLGTLAAGHLHELRVRRVWVTGTTATGIVGLH